MYAFMYSFYKNVSTLACQSASGKVVGKRGHTSNHRHTISSPDKFAAKASFTIPNFFSSNCHFHSPRIKIHTMYNRVKVINDVINKTKLTESTTTKAESASTARITPVVSLDFRRSSSWSSRLEELLSRISNVA